ncbi:MAG: hypothetical protein J6386_08530 [Candidatus Synoicihabitans palmerolidicus]|nr:hypothetical protein [Candidatus Synoicihabitans palmerolidicus]
MDIGDNHDIHPRNKQDVGARLAAIALSRIHGVPGATSGPTYVGVTRDGGRLRIGFDHVGTGLVARDGPVRELEVAGADGVFHPATGEITGTVLIASSPEVSEPVTVRYAWTNGLEINFSAPTACPSLHSAATISENDSIQKVRCSGAGLNRLPPQLLAKPKPVSKVDHRAPLSTTRTRVLYPKRSCWAMSPSAPITASIGTSPT